MDRRSSRNRTPPAIIPEERPALSVATPRCSLPNTVYFGKAPKDYVDCPSRGQAELVVRLANLGVAGPVKVPADLQSCFKLLDRVNVRLDKARARFQELAESRTGDERVRKQLMDVLERWFVLGREPTEPGAPPESDVPGAEGVADSES